MTFKFVEIWMKLTCNAICDVSFLRFRLIMWLLPAVLSSVLPPPSHRRMTSPSENGGGRKLNLNEKLVFYRSGAWVSIDNGSWQLSNQCQSDDISHGWRHFPSAGDGNSNRVTCHVTPNRRWLDAVGFFFLLDSPPTAGGARNSVFNERSRTDIKV